MQEQKEYYVISELAMMTGLTDRTIRNYIAAGILQGEKVDGVWHFSPEQVTDFTTNQAVRPSILAKNNSLVYDFLLEDNKKRDEMCVILDLPTEKKKTVAEFFCKNITEGDYHGIHFTFDGVGAMSRVILKGEVADVMKLVNDYEAYCVK